MKIKNIKKLLIRNLILCGSLLLTLNIESNAIDGNIDLTHKSIVRSFGGSGNEYLYSIIETSDRGILVAGESSSIDAGFDNKGSDDAIIIKYDKYGRKEWIKNFGGSKYDSFSSVIETRDKGIIAVGYSSSVDVGFTNSGKTDAIVVKYDKDGNQLWVKNFGGSNREFFYSVVESSDGGIIAVGKSDSSDAEFGAKGDEDAIVVKYDSEGNQLWVKNFGGSASDEFNSVVESSDGGIIAVGDSNSTNTGFTNKGGIDAIVVKYDKDGNQQWAKSFGGSDVDTFNSVIETSDKGIIAVGYSNSINAGFNSKGGGDGIVIKYDNEGNQLWIKNFSGSGLERFDSVVETSDKGIMATGFSNSVNAGFTNRGGNDAVIVKYNSEGNEQWIKNFGGVDEDCFESVIETSDNGILAVGYSWSIDAGFVNKGMCDIVIVKYNQDCKDNEYIFDKVYELENTDNNINNIEKLEETRNLVNNIENEELRRYLNEKLDSFNIGFGELERKTASANLDLYIKSENILMMSLDTSSITFEDFSGVEDVVKTNAVNISINSSLPYQINAYLPTEIQNSDKTNTMDKRILNIKENSETNYQTFANTTDKIILKDNCPAGNDLIHGVDIELKGRIAHEKDVYKTTIKFEAEQK